MTDSGNVSRHFNAVGQTYARDFAQRRVRFLRRLGIHASTDSAFLRRALQSRTGRLVLHLLAAFAYQLIDRRHRLPLTKNYVALKAQKDRHLPLSGTSPAVSAGNCPASYADSG